MFVISRLVENPPYSVCFCPDAKIVLPNFLLMTVVIIVIHFRPNISSLLCLNPPDVTSLRTFTAITSHLT